MKLPTFVVATNKLPIKKSFSLCLKDFFCLNPNRGPSWNVQKNIRIISTEFHLKMFGQWSNKIYEWPAIKIQSVRKIVRLKPPFLYDGNVFQAIKFPPTLFYLFYVTIILLFQKETKGKIDLNWFQEMKSKEIGENLVKIKTNSIKNKLRWYGGFSFYNRFYFTF